MLFRSPGAQPWPTYPMLFRVSSAHEEGGERLYAVSTKEFLGDDDGNVRALRLVDVVLEGGRLTEVEGTEREIPADLVLFALGFVGPQLVDRFDAVVLAVGATAARDLPIPGRELGGIHQAMEFLPQANRASLGTRRTCPRCRACSSPATPAAGSR